MNLIKQAGDHLEFQLSKRERDLMLQVLQFYPQIPAGYQPLSKTAGGSDSNQRLLDEALEEARFQNKTQLQRLLSDSGRFSRSAAGNWHLRLSSAELDWLLQVLNDIRVGSWLKLGSPEKPLHSLNGENAPYIWAMEMSGYFQGGFLEMLEK
ncbi:MAG TPA: hypothetical protein VL793_15340 [Patescibacteria group bacterium]|nr:hypothetical protein [Patescibacteria group bacterium]